MKRRLEVVLVCSWLVTGCTATSNANDDGAQVLRALASTLTADRKDVCVDNETTGDTWSIYRAMMALPGTSRPALNWHEPTSLRSPSELSGKQVLNGELRSDEIVLRRPTQSGAPLPQAQQRVLDLAARRLAIKVDDEARPIESWSGAPRLKPAWWGFNRLNGSCSPRYSFSHPAVTNDLAFVAVTAGHWGTIYAFGKSPSGWKTIGQWTNWLY